MERETGLEPATNSLEGCDSTIELLPPFQELSPYCSNTAPLGYCAPRLNSITFTVLKMVYRSSIGDRFLM